MNEIDEIMSLISWERDATDQEKGIEEAKDVENINVFLQPRNARFDKNVWENCAIILANREDEELTPYLFELLSWLQDMNWPGASCILDRINRLADKKELKHACAVMLKIAEALEDQIWRENLLKVNV